MTPEEDEDKLLLVSMVYSMGGLTQAIVSIEGTGAVQERWFMDGEDVSSYVVRAIWKQREVKIVDVDDDTGMVVTTLPGGKGTTVTRASRTRDPWWRRLADWWRRLGTLTHGEDL